MHAGTDMVKRIIIFNFRDGGTTLAIEVWLGGNCQNTITLRRGKREINRSERTWKEHLLSPKSHLPLTRGNPWVDQKGEVGWESQRFLRVLVQKKKVDKKILRSVFSFVNGVRCRQRRESASSPESRD